MFLLRARHRKRRPHGRVFTIFALFVAMALGFAPTAIAETVPDGATEAAVEAVEETTGNGETETDNSAITAEEPVTEPEPEPAPAPAPQPEPEPVTNPEPTEPRAPPAEDATTTESAPTDNETAPATTADEPVNNSASAEEETAPAPQAAAPEREAITAVPPPVVVAPTCEADGYVLDPVDTRYWFDVIPVPDGTGFVAKALTDISKYYFELENGINDTEHLITGDLKKLSGAECEVDTGNGDDGDGEDTGNGTDPQPGDGDETDERAVDEDGFPIEPIPGHERIYIEVDDVTVTATSVGDGRVSVLVAVPDVEPYGNGRFAVMLYESLDGPFYGHDDYVAIERGFDRGVTVTGVPDGTYIVFVYYLWDRQYSGETLPYDAEVLGSVVVSATDQPSPPPGTGDGDEEDGDTSSNPGDQPGEDDDQTGGGDAEPVDNPEDETATPEAIAAERAAEYPGSTGTVVSVNDTSFTVPSTEGVAYPAVILKEAASIQLAGAGFSVPVAEEGGFWKYQDPAPGDVLTLPSGGVIDYAIVISRSVSTGDEDNEGEQPTSCPEGTVWVDHNSDGKVSEHECKPNPTPDTGNGDEGENGEEPGTQPDDDPYDDTDSGDNPSGGGQDDDELKGFTESVKVKGCIVKGFISNPNDVPVVYSIVIGESGEEIELTVPANGREKFIITDLPAGEHSITIADRSSSVTTSVVVEECVVDEPEVVTEPTGSITVDCHGVGEAIADNTASTTGNLGNLGFELRYQTADGAQTKTVTVPGGKESEPVTFSGALPGTKVSLWALDAKVASAIVPAACEEPTEPPVTPEPPVDEPTDEEPQAPKPPVRPDQPTVVEVVLEVQAPPVHPGYQAEAESDDELTAQAYGPRPPAQLAETGVETPFGWIAAIVALLIALGAGLLFASRRRSATTTGQ